ncbi:MAG: aminotransferase class IV [Verrucomicrobiota bacterium]|nr:aminotransferase class IV [Limisphaera sp.]MDW8380956.1 aminotransferase class IV [Verrucomicrobiota bacterium]
MTVFHNGRYVSAEEAHVSIWDRGLLYGDGVFETLPVVNGRPFLWKEHLHRWRAGASFLGIAVPLDEAVLRTAAEELMERNQLSDGVLRLTLTRGPGPRGYSPRGAGPPTLIMTLEPSGTTSGQPKSWDVITAQTRAPAPGPLSAYKTCNRLAQVLARAEADAAGAHEALLTDGEGRVIEASAANVFWVDEAGLWSPGPEQGALDGITRRWVLAFCRSRGWPVHTAAAGIDQVRRAMGIFLTLSTLGVVEIVRWDGQAVHRWSAVRELQEAYAAALQTNTELRSVTGDP